MQYFEFLIQSSILVSSLQFLWFESSIKKTIANFIFSSNLATQNSLDIYIHNILGKGLSKPFTCPVCFSFWSSVLCAIFNSEGLNKKTAIIGGLSIPILANLLFCSFVFLRNRISDILD